MREIFGFVRRRIRDLSRRAGVGLGSGLRIRGDVFHILGTRIILPTITFSAFPVDECEGAEQVHGSRVCGKRCIGRVDLVPEMVHGGREASLRERKCLWKGTKVFVVGGR